MANLYVPFTISVVGNVTGETFKGKFSAKPHLSFRDELLQDKIRRELLGPDAEHASEAAKIQSFMFSQLAVRIVDAPGWWKDNGNGLDLVDDNVIAEVYQEVMRIEKEALKELQEKGDKALDDLKKIHDENQG